jgi:Undecaprenyl-phosphate galactose phosphotransferase WbaP
MSKKARGRLDRLIIVAGDVLSIVLGFVLALVFCLWTGLIELSSSDDGWLPGAGWLRAWQFLIVVPVLVGIFWARGHYSWQRPEADEWLDIIKSVTFAAMLELLLFFMMKWSFSRAWFVITWFLVLVLIPFTRFHFKWLLVRSGRWIKNTLIVGTGKNALDTAQMLESDPLFGMKVVAFMESSPSQGRRTDRDIPHYGTIALNGKEIPVIGDCDGFAQARLKYDVAYTVVALDITDMPDVTRLLLDAKLDQTAVHIVPNLRGLPLTGMEVLHFFRHDLFMLHIRNNLARKMPQRIKRGFDLILSIILMVLFSPLLIVCAVIIGWSRQGVVFHHERIGQNGKHFFCYKFRTMVPDADQCLAELLAANPSAREEWERDFKLKDDPRVTRFGRFLRRTSIDELPQLWNVIKGEMSLVGPRPIVESELERYGDKVRYYLQAKPGISGLWQISGRSDTDYATRVHMDTWYVKNWTLWYDFFVLIKTIQVVGLRGGAR